MCLCLIFSWPPAGFSGSSVLLNRACAGISRWGGQGIWDSGAGALDVSVKSASRAVSPITVDCQCPHKVNQVHNRQSFTPRSDGCFLCSACFCSHLTVGVKMSALAVCSSVFLSPENLELCLFVRWQTDRRGGRRWNRDRRHILNGFSRAPVNGNLLPLVFAQKEPFCFPAGQSSFLQRAWTTLLLLPWRMFTHKYAQINPYRIDPYLVCICHLGWVRRWHMRQSSGRSHCSASSLQASVGFGNFTVSPSVTFSTDCTLYPGVAPANKTCFFSKNLFMLSPFYCCSLLSDGSPYPPAMPLIIVSNTTACRVFENHRVKKNFIALTHKFPDL